MLKSILLGSAAVMVLIGGASAADLTVAEPVDYVKVCDAFGAGYFYSPGTDTCLKIGGYVKFKTQAAGGSDIDSTFNQFYTEASLQLTASSVTEFGNLTGYYELRTRTGTGYVPAVGVDTNTYIKQGYIKLAGLQAGHFTSLFDFGRGYTDTGAFGSDVETDHIAYTYAAGPFALSLSVEDPSDRLKVATGYEPEAPDLVAAIGYVNAPFTAKIAGAYVQTPESGAYSATILPGEDSGYAVGASVEYLLDAFNKGDKFTLQGAYADNAPSYTGLAGNTSLMGTGALATATPGWSWSALASYKHVWSSQWNSSITGGYLDSEYMLNTAGKNYTGGSGAWRGVINTVFTPVKGLDILAEGLYTKSDYYGNDGYRWQANLFLKRYW